MMATSRYVLPATLLLAIVCLTPCAFGFERKKFEALLSANETKGAGGSSWTVSWNLDAEWVKPTGSRTLTVSLDSDYSKSDTAKLDRLRLGFRMLDDDYGKITRKWYPVYLVQTEGDHGGDSIHTLGAAGYRQKRGHGFIELTVGASKDIRTSEGWVGDIGAQIGYQKKLGPKWTVRTGPKGELGAIGDVRFRGDRFRYSWDAALDYRASDKLGIGYRLWSGNTVPNSRRTQWIGLTYKLK